VALRDKLLPGVLCTVVPRGRAAYGYEIFGAYFNGEEGYKSEKTTGENLSRVKDCGKSMPFMQFRSSRIQQGAIVVVVHSPVNISSKRARTNMGLTRTSTLCEVLTPDDGKTRWIKSGLLRVVR
jgi:hypothetical protein